MRGGSGVVVSTAHLPWSVSGSLPMITQLAQARAGCVSALTGTQYEPLAENRRKRTLSFMSVLPGLKAPGRYIGGACGPRDCIAPLNVARVRLGPAALAPASNSCT